MFIEVTKSNFKISEDHITPALKAVVSKHPAIKEHLMFKQKQNDVERLQISLYFLGFHTRVNPLGFIFGIKSLLPNPLVPNDYMETFKLLSPYTDPDSWVALKADKELNKISFDALKGGEILPEKTEGFIETFIPASTDVEQKPAIKKRGRQKKTGVI